MSVTRNDVNGADNDNAEYIVFMTKLAWKILRKKIQVVFICLFRMTSNNLFLLQNINGVENIVILICMASSH